MSKSKSEYAGLKDNDEFGNTNRATREIAEKIIGKKRLYGLRHESNPRKVRLFVVDRPITSDPDAAEDDIYECTGLVARVIGKKLDKGGHWLLASNYGYCPIQGVAGDYALAMGESDNKDTEHLYRKL